MGPRLTKPGAACACRVGLGGCVKVRSTAKKGSDGEATAKDPTDVPPGIGRRAASKAGAAGKGDPVEPTGRALAEAEVQELWLTLFGTDAEEDDVQRWLLSRFAFVGAAGVGHKGTPVAEESLPCPWGLRQELGGPCGILAVAQAFVLQHLLWGEDPCLRGKPLARSPSAVSTAASSDSDSEAPLRHPWVARRRQGSAAAAGAPGPLASLAPGGVRPPETSAFSARLTQRFEGMDSQELLASALARILHNAAPSSKYVWADVLNRSCIIQRDFPTARALAEWLVTKDTLKSATCPLLSFVCSLIMTRGLQAVHSDMDSATVPLIGVFGHCSQELTNLCLAGRAVTNVFDGELAFEDCEDRVLLRGMHASPEVGFLSALEPLRLCEVGTFLKQPRYPLWVLGSSSHYSLLVSDDCSLNHISCRPGGDRAQPCQACGGDAHGECSSAKLWHFNGRADSECTRPTLRLVELKFCSPQTHYEPAPLPAGDQDIRLFAEVLRTRWPGAEVSHPQVGDTSSPARPPRID